MRDDYGIAEATGDVMLAADAVNDDGLQRLIYISHGLYERQRAYGFVGDADFLHAITRLACALRDKRAAEFRAMKRSIRKAEGVEPARA